MEKKENTNFFKQIFRRIKYHEHKIKRIQDTPNSIAMGAAIGVFWGVFPTFMLGIPLSIGTAAIFKVNKTAAVIGSFIMNPLTSPFFWVMSAYVGGLVTRTDWKKIIKLAANLDLSQLAKSTAWIYLLGNTIVSVFFAYLTFLFVQEIIKKHQAKKIARLEIISNKNKIT
ncbi:DUF2062 domain-containing protein [Candidatus Poribacteria bacterium]|nr:DUF2062 domain-containing protein [Candidatus Poribacteria bacterium]